MHRAPTVDDLRVKLCYVCHEEETYDAPESPPRRWVHPCSCTLIAHEDCLLQWIRSTERNSSRAAGTILRCPQCKTRYVMESSNPIILRAMDHARALLTVAGHGAAILTIGAAVTAVATGVYIVITSYGAFALRCFIGPEMFKLLVSDDVHRWPLHAFINMPMIPISLIMNRTRRFRDTLPLIPLLALWPSSPVVVSSPRGFLSFLGLGGYSHFRMVNNPPLPSQVWEDTIRDLFCSWPPSPLMLNIGYNIVRRRYVNLLDRFRRYILGNDPLAQEVNGFGPGQEHDQGDPADVIVENFAVEMRIVDDGNEDDDEEEGGQEGAAQENDGEDHQEEEGQNEERNGQDQALRDDNNVRLVLDGAAEPAGDEPLPPAELPVPVDHAPVPPPPLPEAQDADANANIDGRGGERPVQQPNRGVVPPAEDQNVGRARLQLRLTGATIGSLIGGALLMPPIAAGMGALLLRLALPSAPLAHDRIVLDAYRFSPISPRYLLQRFLAIRPPRSARALAITDVYAMPRDHNSTTYTQMTAALIVRVLLIGTPAWTDSDPVWWRNTLGLGLFCVAKDMLTVWYQYLSQREMRSRRLKDRDFSGIDSTVLDLRPDVRREQFAIESNSEGILHGNTNRSDAQDGNGHEE